jgi:cell wall-associated NlpC family hydrolase
MNPCLAAAAVSLLVLLSGCATALKPTEEGNASALQFQNLALNPSNGGQLVSAGDLQPGDIILTAENGLNSVGIRIATLSPVSHAAIYLGNQMVAEAVGAGIRRRSVAALMNEEATVVALRHPKITAEHAEKINTFAASHEGSKYNYIGVVLQAPFALERRMCELPLMPSLVRDFCIRGIAAVQLGLGSNKHFFCSQFILEAYRSAGLALTDADPRLVNPGDLLHMREGDVPSIRIHQPLLYIGHLKAPPQIVAENESRY